MNRPFAGPGDFVEVRVRPAICDKESTGFVDVDGDGLVADDYVVTVLFAPPALSGGVANATVIADECTGINLAACDAALGGTVQCVEVNPPGGPDDLVVSSASELQFRFPDTDARLDALNDDRTFAGPAKIVVSRRGMPLQCGLASASTRGSCCARREGRPRV